MLLCATMASGYMAPVNAVQVGSYFVGQYYQVLQQRPSLVHQFYTDLSTLVHNDGSTSETASGMLKIHNLIMSRKFNGIEIKTAHSLESWSGGVLVMVSGSVQNKELSGCRKFVQTFFLAPQEKGYFVLNDIFHLQDEEQFHLPQAPMFVHNDFDPLVNGVASVPETVSDYVNGREMENNVFAVPATVEEAEVIEKYSSPEPEQHIEGDDGDEEEISAEESVASFPSGPNLQDQPPPVEETIGEQPKHTYASILRAAKGQSGHVVASQPAVVKNVTVASELQSAPHATSHQSHSGSGKSSWAEDVTTLEDEGEVKSVYVRNLPSSASVSDLEWEFKNFGRIRPDGVLIKSRKEAGVYYAFVEFEDIAGVQNALKASPIPFGGRQIHVEERRPGSFAARGRRGRGRGGGGYSSEAPRGRFSSRAFSRGSGQDSIENSSRPRGNGYHQQGPRQERVTVGGRNGQSFPNAPS